MLALRRLLLLLHVRVPVRRATMPRRADESIPEEQVRGACGVPRVFVRCVTGGSVQGGVFCYPLARGGRDDSFFPVPHTLRYKNCKPCNGQARISDDLTTARSMCPPRRIYAHRHERNTSMSFSEREAPSPLLPPGRHSSPQRGSSAEAYVVVCMLYSVRRTCGARLTANKDCCDKQLEIAGV